MEALERIVDAVRQRPLTAVLATNAATALVALYIISEGKPAKFMYKAIFSSILSALPSSVMDAEQDKLRKSIEKDVVGHEMQGETLYAQLPAKGLPEAEIIQMLQRYSAKDEPRWKRGKVSGTVYYGGDDLTNLMTEAFRRYALSNPLHPDVFPSLRKMEAEVVAMTLSLFNAGPAGCGTMTSGGTESILMACKAYRDYARSTRGVTEPELVCPTTAHAAFDKACAYFGIKMVHVPVDPATFRADVRATERAITRNTIAIVCSAPSYAQGVIDPVPELGALALSRGGIPVHVDCCLGSYLVAHAGRAGFPTRVPFDFSVPGVTSISVDTHKYGFAPKGSSVVMYSRRDLRSAQYFVASEWTGGIYASPSIAGSRAGAIIAACWVTLLKVGSNGYTDAAGTILRASKKIADGVRAMSREGAGIELYGEPDLSVVCFGPARSAATGSGRRVNIYNVGDAMSSRGWNLNALQNPPCMHLCVTFANAGSADAFLADLAASVEEVRTAPPGKFKDGTGAMYGMASSIPDKSLVASFTHHFLDALYAPRVVAAAD